MLEIHELNNQHNRKIFDCGNTSINNYLKQQSHQAAKRNYSRTHVLIDDPESIVIIGYYTLTSCFLDTKEQALIHMNAPYPLCGLKLARMGIDTKHQNKGYSGDLIIDALMKTCQVNQTMGVQGLFVDAKTDELISYYQHYGFESIIDNGRHMWLPIGTAQQLFESSED